MALLVDPEQSERSYGGGRPKARIGITVCDALEERLNQYEIRNRSRTFSSYQRHSTCPLPKGCLNAVARHVPLGKMVSLKSVTRYAGSRVHHARDHLQLVFEGQLPRPPLWVTQRQGALFPGNGSSTPTNRGSSGTRPTRGPGSNSALPAPPIPPVLPILTRLSNYPAASKRDVRIRLEDQLPDLTFAQDSHRDTPSD